MQERITRTRNQVLQGFKQTDHTFCYSHKLPFTYQSFIDLMAFVTPLAAAAHLLKDTELEHVTTSCIQTMIDCGPDTRNFAPIEVNRDKWTRTKQSNPFWIIQKPQSFAGPAALYWAIKNGVQLDPKWVQDPSMKARFITIFANVFGSLLKPISKFHQHTNSIMFAFLLLNKRPPNSLHWLAKNNMLYSYIFNEKCTVPYENTGAFPAKDQPFNPDLKTQLYTPTCELTALYLQTVLDPDLPSTRTYISDFLI